jgi:hypothetical protein
MSGRPHQWAGDSIPGPRKNVLRKHFVGADGQGLADTFRCAGHVCTVPLHFANTPKM